MKELRSIWEGQRAWLGCHTARDAAARQKCPTAPPDVPSGNHGRHCLPLVPDNPGAGVRTASVLPARPCHKFLFPMFGCCQTGLNACDWQQLGQLPAPFVPGILGNVACCPRRNSISLLACSAQPLLVTLFSVTSPAAFFLSLVIFFKKNLYIFY